MINNDYFTKVYGKYAFVEKDVVEMKVYNISKSVKKITFSFCKRRKLIETYKQMKNIDNLIKIFPEYEDVFY